MFALVTLATLPTACTVGIRALAGSFSFWTLAVDPLTVYTHLRLYHYTPLLLYAPSLSQRDCQSLLRRIDGIVVVIFSRRAQTGPIAFSDLIPLSLAYSFIY